MLDGNHLNNKLAQVLRNHKEAQLPLNLTIVSTIWQTKTISESAAKYTDIMSKKLQNKIAYLNATRKIVLPSLETFSSICDGKYFGFKLESLSESIIF